MPPKQYTDAVFGPLQWDGSAWLGTLVFAEQHVQLLLDTSTTQPTDAEQRAVINFAAELLPRVRAAEATLRQQAAQEIAEAAGSQADPATAEQFLGEVAASAAALKPSSLVFVLDAGGQIEYRDASGTFIPDATIIVRFDDEAAYEEAEISDD